MLVPSPECQVDPCVADDQYDSCSASSYPTHRASLSKNWGCGKPAVGVVVAQALLNRVRSSCFKGLTDACEQDLCQVPENDC
eukprot:1011372-Pelagomonas_calceolata.AAC.1